MFKAGNTVPKLGEIRLGYVRYRNNDTHKYTGLHPYLIVSNDSYNQHSGQSEVIPFTTKRLFSKNPVHVNFEVGEVEGLERNSTLVIEGRDTLKNSSLSNPIGMFSEENWVRAVNAMAVQCPFIETILQKKYNSKVNAP